MKKLLAISSLALAALAPLSAQAVGTLYMSPAKQDVAVGADVSVDVFISGLGSEIVSAFDLNVLFSSAILGAPGSVDFNEPILGGDDSEWDVAFAPGNWGITAYSLLTTDDEVAALQGDDPLKLFTMTFTALTDGVTNLSFGLPPDFDRNVAGRDATSLQLSYAGACVAVGTAQGRCDVPVIPEPSTYALMLLGLGAVGAAARSRKRA